MREKIFPFRSGDNLCNSDSTVQKVIFVERDALPENVGSNSNATGRDGGDLCNPRSTVPKVVFLKRAPPSDISVTD